jgi:putative SOS response-associated peptidase YedK
MLRRSDNATYLSQGPGRDRASWAFDGGRFFPIHNRMPVMLDHDDALKWLNVDDEIAHALSLLKPYPPDRMDVSTLVNNPRNDSPECVQPIEG